MLRYLAATLCGLILLALPLLVTAQTTTSAHDPSRWHPPAAGHEHGDAPPAWLLDFTTDPRYAPYWTLNYDFPGNTSPAENTVKHFAFKGLHLASPAFKDQDGGWVDGYAIGHISGTPADRGAMVHSFRLFIADAGGGLTIRQGWVNMGSPETARVPRRCQSSSGGSDCPAYGDPTQRPIVLTVTDDDVKGTYSGGRSETFEQWYGFGSGASWGWGLNTPTIFQPGEKASDTDPHAWHTVGGQAYGQLRLIEVIASKPTYHGGFWMTPTGEYVEDPSNPDCNSRCLLQWISPTYKGITGRTQQTWPLPADVALPN